MPYLCSFFLSQISRILFVNHIWFIGVNYHGPLRHLSWTSASFVMDHYVICHGSLSWEKCNGGYSFNSVNLHFTLQLSSSSMPTLKIQDKINRIDVVLITYTSKTVWYATSSSPACLSHKPLSMDVLNMDINQGMQICSILLADFSLHLIIRLTILKVITFYYFNFPFRKQFLKLLILASATNFLSFYVVLKSETDLCSGFTVLYDLFLIYVRLRM